MTTRRKSPNRRTANSAQPPEGMMTLEWQGARVADQNFRFELIKAPAASPSFINLSAGPSVELFMSIGTFCDVMAMDEKFAKACIVVGALKVQYGPDGVVVPFESFREFFVWLDDIKLRTKDGQGPIPFDPIAAL